MAKIPDLRSLSVPEARYDRPETGGEVEVTGDQSVAAILKRAEAQAGNLQSVIVVGSMGGEGIAASPMWFSSMRTPEEWNAALQLLRLAILQLERLRPGLAPQPGYHDATRDPEFGP